MKALAMESGMEKGHKALAQSARMAWPIWNIKEIDHYKVRQKKGKLSR
jgi:hypothetical protein